MLLILCPVCCLLTSVSACQSVSTAHQLSCPLSTDLSIVSAYQDVSAAPHSSHLMHSNHFLLCLYYKLVSVNPCSSCLLFVRWCFSSCLCLPECECHPLIHSLLTFLTFCLYSPACECCLLFVLFTVC